MKAGGSSLTYRGGARAWAWLVVAGRASWTGRFLVAVGAFLRAAAGDSLFFGTAAALTRPLGSEGHPQVVAGPARLYLWLRAHLTPLGRIRPATHFGAGRWVLPLGAGLLALGVGRLGALSGRGSGSTGAGATLDPAVLAAIAPPLALRLVIPCLLVVLGALLLGAGPGLVRNARGAAALRAGRRVGGWLGGTAPSPAESGQTRSSVRPGPVVWLGTALALVAGATVGWAGEADALLATLLVAALALVVVVLWRPEVILLAVAVFPWLDWAARRVLGGFGPAWDDALLLVSLVLVAWSVLVLGRARLWTVPILLPALLAFGAGLGSVVVGQVPSEVGVFALRALFQPLLFFVVAFLLPKNRCWVRAALALFVLTGVGLALHGLFQYVTHAPMPASWVDVRETAIGTRAYSIIENPNGLGAFLLIGTLLSLSLALAPRLPRAQRGMMAVACLVQLGGVAVTFSRGAWLGLGAGVVALFLLAYRRYLAPLVGAGVVAWFVAPSQFTDRLAFAFSSAYISKSLVAGRLYVWALALRHIAAHPWFGLGLGTFGGTAAVRFSYGRLWVDNFYLQLAAEGGLILLVLFLWILLRAAKGLVRAHRRSTDPFLQALAAGAFGAFVAVAVANLTAGVWETLVVGVAFWFWAGLATSAVLHMEAPEEGDAA